MAAAESETIVYRPIALRDLDALQALHSALNASERNPFTTLESAPQVGWELKRLRKQLMASERYVCVVASAGEAGALIGYCAGVVEQAPPIFALTHYGTVSELYVVEAYRRRGVARELLQRVLEGLSSRGVRMVEATVSVHQAAGQALLEGLGFEPQTVHLGLALNPVDSGED